MISENHEEVLAKALPDLTAGPVEYQRQLDDLHELVSAANEAVALMRSVSGHERRQLWNALVAEAEDRAADAAEGSK